MGEPRTPGTEKYLPDRVEMTVWGDRVRATGTVAQGWGHHPPGLLCGHSSVCPSVVIDMWSLIQQRTAGSSPGRGLGVRGAGGWTPTAPGRGLADSGLCPGAVQVTPPDWHGTAWGCGRQRPKCADPCLARGSSVGAPPRCVCHRLRLPVHTPHLWGLGVKQPMFAVLLGDASPPGPPRDPLALNASPGCQSTSFWFGAQMALSRGTGMSAGVSGEAQQEVLVQKQRSVI